MSSKLIKLFAVTAMIAIVAALILVAARIISWKLFWAVAIVCGIIAYFVIPWLRRVSGS